MPVDRGAIDAMLKEIGAGERWWDQREFRDLPYILDTDERIHGLVNGRIFSRRRPRVLPAAPWLIVATSQRLICLQQVRFGRKQEDIRLGQITGIRHDSRLTSYQITLETRQRKYRLRIPKADAFGFLRALAPLLQQQPTPEGQPPVAGAPAPSWIPGRHAIASLPGLSALSPKSTMLNPTDYATRADLERVETTVDRLEKEVERLQQQVEFLEDLLQTRAADGVLSLPAHAAAPTRSDS